MKTLLLMALVVCLAGALHAQDLPVVGLRKTYAAKIKPRVKARIDSTVTATLQRFNTGAYAFRVVPDAAALSSIAIDIRKGKLATRKQRNIAYAVNAIAPIYLPAHTIRSTVAFSPSPASTPMAVTVRSQARVMVANISRREEKMLTKYGDRLYEALLEMEARWWFDRSVAQR